MNVAEVLGRFGARIRLVALLAMAVLPLGGLIAYALAHSYDVTLEMARADLRRSASMAADVPGSLFANARSMLRAAKADPAITVAGGEACRSALRSLLSGSPQFLTMGVIDADGTITCHSRITERQAIGDRSLALRTLAPGAAEAVVGNFMIGKVTGRPTVAVASALSSDRGGAAFVSLNLELLAAAAEGASDTGHLAVTMIQPASARMLTHYPPVPIAFGTSLEGSALVDAMRSSPEGGIVEAPGPDGVDRVYAFQPVRGGDTGMMLAIGEPRSAILEPVARLARTTSALAVVVLAAALAVAWWAGWVTQVRPLERMTRFVRRLEVRETDARIEMEAWQSPELRLLGQTLNSAAASLDAARRAEEAVAASETRFRLLAENTADLVTSLDANGVRTFVSPASRDILGREPSELMGVHVLDTAHPDDRGTVSEMLATLRSGQTVGGVRYRMPHRDGRDVWVEVSGRPLDGGARMTLSVRDVSRRRAMEEELERANRTLAELASTDGLTGLLNRRGFDEALEREMARCVRDRVDLSLLMVDVDCFKAFNDTYGHLEGDECLQRVALAILGVMRRPGDIAARYGGEEIAVILPGTPGDGGANRARAIVDTVRALSIANAGSGHGVVTVSVGVAVASTTASGSFTASELIGRADKALYAAKLSGRDRVVEWRPELAA